MDFYSHPTLEGKRIFATLDVTNVSETYAQILQRGGNSFQWAHSPPLHTHYFQPADR